MSSTEVLSNLDELVQTVGISLTTTQTSVMCLVSRAHCQFFTEYIFLTTNQMVCSCNSGIISTRKYFKDNKSSSLRSFNFMFVFEIFTCAN